MAKSRNRKSDRAVARKKVREKAQRTVDGASNQNWMTLPKDVTKEDFFEHKKGTNKFAILPYEVSVDNHPEGLNPGDLWYEKTVLVHYGVGVNNKSVVCPRNWDKKCPICEHGREMEDEEEARQCWPSKRQIFNVLHNGDVKLWAMAFGNFGKLLEKEILADEDQEYDGFYFLEKDDGYDLKVRFGQESFAGNKYLAAEKIDFKPRTKDLSEDLYDEVFDLDTLVECPSYQDVKDLFFAEEEEEEGEAPKKSSRRGRKKKEEEEEEETPKRSSRRGKKKKKEEEEEEEEAPKKTSRRGKKKKKEEEEEEPPKKSSRKKKKKKEEEEEECPNGLEFGVDCDEEDVCDECDLWDVCSEKQQEME